MRGSSGALVGLLVALLLGASPGTGPPNANVLPRGTGWWCWDDAARLGRCERTMERCDASAGDGHRRPQPSCLPESNAWCLTYLLGQYQRADCFRNEDTCRSWHAFVMERTQTPHSGTWPDISECGAVP